MKILKIILFAIGGVLLLLFGFQFTKVSKTSTTKLKDAMDNLLGKNVSGANTDTKVAPNTLGNSSLLKTLKPTTTPKLPIVKTPKEESNINEAGIDLTSYLGLFTIDGVNDVALYGIRNGLPMPEGVGFTSQGVIVYREIRNEGTPEEYNFYHT